MTLKAMIGMGRPLPRALGTGLACALLLAACGRPNEDVERAQAAAEAARERVDDLEATLTGMAAELEGLNEGAAAWVSDRDDLVRRIERAARRLRASLSSVRRGLKEVRSSSSEAATSASAAVAEVGSIAHGLAVLKNRYDYHLRQYHEGEP